MELNILNSPDGTALPVSRHTIPLWRILLSIALFATVLLVSTIVVCTTNEQCRARIPTMSNLLQSTFVSPFLITGLNCLLSLQLFISVGVYYKTQVKARYWSKLVMLTAILLYVSVVVTLFVFPFTDWDRNWANVSILVSLNVWMAMVVIALKRFYRHRIDNKRKLLNASLFCNGLYFLSSLAYVILRQHTEDWLLVSEILSAIAIGGFLVLSLAHIWHLEFSISVP